MYDVIVVGGGIIGCSVAWQLAKRKQKVLVVERTDVASGSAGATDGFVRGPFIVEGLILGVMGAAAAFLIQWAVYAAVCRAFVESGAVTLFTLMEFKEIWTQVLGIFLTAGAAIGAVGSGFAIRRFLQV